jgi:hypothetical protein
VATKQLNPLESDVHDLADAYVELVMDLVEEFAPFRPWWTTELSADQKLWRYMEVRDAIVPWLVEVGVYMGYRTWQEVLDNLDKIWMSKLPIDTTPPEILAALPLELLELVQAGPNDAAQHIRDMEKLFASRSQAAEAMQRAAEDATVTEPDVPELLPPTLPTKAGEIYPAVSPKQFTGIVRATPKLPRPSR